MHDDLALFESSIPLQLSPHPTHDEAHVARPAAMAHLHVDTGDMATLLPSGGNCQSAVDLVEVSVSHVLRGR